MLRAMRALYSSIFTIYNTFEHVLHPKNLLVFIIILLWYMYAICCTNYSETRYYGAVSYIIIIFKQVPVLNVYISYRNFRVGNPLCSLTTPPLPQPAIYWYALGPRLLPIFHWHRIPYIMFHGNYHKSGYIYWFVYVLILSTMITANSIYGTLSILL